MKAHLQEVIQHKVRPLLKQHGGDIEIVSLTDGVCKIKLKGKYSNCYAAKITMEELIKKELFAECPYLTNVEMDDEISQDMIDFARKLLHQ